MSQSPKKCLTTISLSVLFAMSLTACQNTSDRYSKAENEEYPQSIAYTPDAEPEGLVTVIAQQQPAVGVATSYDPRINELETASGELYDPREMTAAHNSFPFATYVKVRNLDNMKETIVKVNDRITTGKNEMVKLSYAAAYRLGIYSGGKANVEITPLQFQANPKPAKVQAKRNPEDIPVESVGQRNQTTSLETTASTQTDQNPESTQSSLSQASATQQQAAFDENPQPSLTPVTVEPAIQTPSIQPTTTTHSAQNQLTVKPEAEQINKAVETSKSQNDLSQAANTASGTYMQIGAFRNKTYAKALVASVAGIARETETDLGIFESNSNGEPIYKVRFGPLQANQVSELERLISESNLKGLVLYN